MRWRRALPALILWANVACSSAPPADEEETWVGTVTTNGDVTTVVNESGSVWNGTATLVEEVSIGVESGTDEYMFGQISSLYATDERIYVVDSQVPALRVYDLDGGFLHTLGREGQGPGEYNRPSLVTADDAGRVYLLDPGLARINVYGPEGEVFDPWPMTDSRCCVWPMFPLSGESVWIPVQEWNEDHTDRRYGVQAVGPQGRYGEVTFLPEFDFRQATFTVEGDFEDISPFSPWLTWNPAPEGALLVGTSDRYWFQVQHRDGSRTVVERYWEPVSVSAERKEWERRRTVSFRRRYSGPELEWVGAEMPDHKPAYWSLIPTLSGEVWVQRPGRSVRLEDCVENPLQEAWPAAAERPCWQDEPIVDVFGVDGRYLGEVDLPDVIGGGTTHFVVDASKVVAVTQDDAGTIRVKRYRLVTPDESQ